MNIFEAFPSKYLKANDLKNQEHTVTISSISPIQFENKGKKQNKLLISFQEMDKQFAAGITSVKTIAKIHGEEMNNWIGKRITLYVKPDVEFGTETVAAIRVRTQPGGNGTPSSGFIAPPPPPNLEYGKEYAKATTSMPDWLTFADSCHVVLGKEKYFKILGGIGFERAEQVGFDDQQRTAAMLWLFDMSHADKTTLLEKHGALLRKLNIIHA